MEKSKYLYRRQFILGTRFLRHLEGWKELRLSDRFVLTIHPDLEYSLASSGKNCIVLLGFILDPDNPSHGNEEIVSRIVHSVNSADEVMLQISRKCGRFVLILNIENEVRMFHDAAGLRQIFYHREKSENTWCASQPSLLAEALDLAVDQNVEEDLRSLPLFRETTEYWFPGKLTFFKDVYHLTPNHYLNLMTGEVVRYWPKECLRQLSFEDVVNESSTLLQGIFASAVKRFEMAFAITGGLDSRVLLAGSRQIIDKMHFITHTHSHLDQDGADITIPREILCSVELDHHIVRHSETVTQEFRDIFARNVSAARHAKEINAYTIYDYFSMLKKDMVVINGNCGEIARSFYRMPNFFKLNGRALSILTNMSGSEAVEKEFDKWLESVSNVQKCGVDVLDLFYWENRNANWAAMTFSEYDIAFESFSPFNCRFLLELLLSSDKSYRMPPRYEMYKALVRRMWPDLLEYPINPPRDWKQAVVKKTKGTKPYELLKFVIFLYRYYLK